MLFPTHTNKLWRTSSAVMWTSVGFKRRDFIRFSSTQTSLLKRNVTHMWGWSSSQWHMLICIIICMYYSHLNYTITSWNIRIISMTQIKMIFDFIQSLQHSPHTVSIFGVCMSSGVRSIFAHRVFLFTSLWLYYQRFIINVGFGRSDNTFCPTTVPLIDRIAG